MHTCRMIALTLPLCLAAAASAQDTLKQDTPKRMGEGEITDVRIVGHVYNPALVEATDERIKSLRVPPGFKVSKWADGLGNPRIIVVHNDGRGDAVYISRRDQKDLLLLRDTDGDGRADSRETLTKREPMVHGIAIHDGHIYLTTVTEILRARLNEDGTIESPEVIIDGLPDGGQHPNRTIAFGPDGMLYISVGSAANAADEPNPEHATMLRADPGNGWERSIFARGLRNTIGFAWHPETRVLFGPDHGIDWLGDDEQQEEFNRIEDGRHYGWPYIYGDGGKNPADKPKEMTIEQFAAKATEPELLYTAHAAPMQFMFYTGDRFPAEYRNDAFITMRGSWNRKPPSGHEVVRVRFDDQGNPKSIEPFLSGFLVKRGDGEFERFGRPVGLAMLSDGSLLIGDDTNGVIYRVEYEGR